MHEDFTVWLLDLHTSVAMQLTREREGNSMHDIVRWEGPRTLLFYRGREVYRVALNLPVQAPKAGDRPSEDRPPSTAAPAGNGRPRQPRERG